MVEGPGRAGGRPSGAVRWWEVAIVVGVVGLIVVVNEGVVHDEGNTWGGLVTTALVPAVLLVVGIRILAERLR